MKINEMDDLFKARAYANGLSFDIQMMLDTEGDKLDVPALLKHIQTGLDKIVSGNITDDEAVIGLG